MLFMGLTTGDMFSGLLELILSLTSLSGGAGLPGILGPLLKLDGLGAGSILGLLGLFKNGGLGGLLGILG